MGGIFISDRKNTNLGRSVMNKVYKTKATMNIIYYTNYWLISSSNTYHDGMINNIGNLDNTGIIYLKLEPGFIFRVIDIYDESRIVDSTLVIKIQPLNEMILENNNKPTTIVKITKSPNLGRVGVEKEIDEESGIVKGYGIYECLSNDYWLQTNDTKETVFFRDIPKGKEIHILSDLFDATGISNKNKEIMHKEEYLEYLE